MDFSKKITLIVLSAYLISFILGVWCVLHNDANLATLLGFIGAPTAIVLPFYFTKAKAENTVGGVVYDTAMAAASKFPESAAAAAVVSEVAEVVTDLVTDEDNDAVETIDTEDEECEIIQPEDLA